MGHTDSGGSASAVAAPAANAIRLRRQPHDRTIEWAMRAKLTMRSRSLEDRTWRGWGKAIAAPPAARGRRVAPQGRAGLGPGGAGVFFIFAPFPPRGRG